MTTYTYTGRVTDAGEAPFPDASPRVTIIPEKATYGPLGVIVGRQMPVTLAANGSFSVELVASADTTDGIRYTMRVEWLGQGDVSRGWSDLLFVAVVGGGAIKDMVDAPVSVWWVGPPWPSPLRKGFYFDKNTNDVGRVI